MLRRSSSSSHIPIPKSLFNTNSDSSGRKRSASTARLSQRNSSTAIARLSHRSSADGKLSLNRLSRQHTPSTSRTAPKRGRQNSLQWSTPCSEQKSQNSLKTGSSAKSQERKTIQKLSTDAKWVSMQYSKVKDFICNSGLFDSSIVTEKNIKPPSLKVFIYVTTVLMKEIFPSFKMTNENYKEVITEKLKVLKYPGVVANSVLKTVYTMHVWPQVIGMFAWLIDKVALRFERTGNLETLDPDCRQKFEITQACRLHILERYSIFNRDNSEEKHLQVNKDLTRKLTNLLNVDPSKYAQLEADIVKNKEYLLKQDSEIKPLQENVKKLGDQIDQLQKEIDDIKERDAVIENELDSEIRASKEKLNKMRDRKIAIATRIQELEESIKTQRCSFQEKKSLLKKIDSLRDEIKIKKDKMEHAQKIKQEYDANINEERVELQNKVTQWNNFLMGWTIRKPQLKPLLLKETGFHHAEYLAEIKEILKNKVAIESYFAKELQRIGGELEEEKATKRNLELEVEELKEAVDELTVENTKRFQVKEELQEKKKKLTAERDIEKKNSEQDQNMFEEKNAKLAQKLGQEAIELQVERDSLNDKVDKFAKNSLVFFLDLHNQVAKDFRELEDIRDQAYESHIQRLCETCENQRVLIETLINQKETLENEIEKKTKC